MIKSSTDWYGIRDTMMANIRECRYKRDVAHMINNIGLQVAELSKAEVDMRRGRKYKAAELLEQINRDIDIVEEFILVAKLIS